MVFPEGPGPSGWTRPDKRRRGRNTTAWLRGSRALSLGPNENAAGASGGVSSFIVEAGSVP